MYSSTEITVLGCRCLELCSVNDVVFIGMGWGCLELCSLSSVVFMGMGWDCLELCSIRSVFIWVWTGFACSHVIQSEQYFLYWCGLGLAHPSVMTPHALLMKIMAGMRKEPVVIHTYKPPALLTKSRPMDLSHQISQQLNADTLSIITDSIKGFSSNMTFETSLYNLTVTNKSAMRACHGLIS